MWISFTKSSIRLSFENRVVIGLSLVIATSGSTIPVEHSGFRWFQNVADRGCGLFCDGLPSIAKQRWSRMQGHGLRSLSLENQISNETSLSEEQIQFVPGLRWGIHEFLRRASVGPLYL